MLETDEHDVKLHRPHPPPICKIGLRESMDCIVIHICGETPAPYQNPSKRFRLSADSGAWRVHRSTVLEELFSGEGVPAEGSFRNLLDPSVARSFTKDHSRSVLIPSPVARWRDSAARARRVFLPSRQSRHSENLLRFAAGPAHPGTCSRFSARLRLHPRQPSAARPHAMRCLALSLRILPPATTLPRELLSAENV